MQPSPARTAVQKREPVASVRQTAGLLCIILLFATSGRILIGNQSPETLEQFGRVPIYVVALASMWILVAYCRSGIHRTMRSLVDQSAWTVRRWLLYGLLALGLFFAWGAIGAAVGTVLRPPPEQIRGILVLLPASTIERVLWVAMSLSAGFCEELVYRGYLQSQFAAWTGSTAAGIILQALCYAGAHAALPPQIAVSLVFLGLLFGAAATWKRTLVPGMLMHAALDLLALVRR